MPEAAAALTNNEIAGRWATHVHQFLEGQTVLAYEWAQASTEVGSLREENGSLKEQLKVAKDKLAVITNLYDCQKMELTAVKKNNEEVRRELKAREERLRISADALRAAERSKRDAEDYAHKLEQLHRESVRSREAFSSQNKVLGEKNQDLEERCKIAEAKTRKLQGDYVKALMNIALDMSEKDDSFHPSQSKSLASISSLWDEKMRLRQSTASKDPPPPPSA